MQNPSPDDPDDTAGAAASTPSQRTLTVAGAAARLRVSPSAVRDAIRRGQLPAHRTPGGHRRVRVEDVERLRRALGVGGARGDLPGGDGDADEPAGHAWGAD
jgi:excisionase family DNA binding protein